MMRYRERVAAAHGSVPLVVNTQGWVKGIGLDLLNSTVASVAPQHVVRVRCLMNAVASRVVSQIARSLDPIPCTRPPFRAVSTRRCMGKPCG